jgi:hypothetical protein
MATIKEFKASKTDSKSKTELIKNLEELIERVKNDEIEIFTGSTLDVNGDIAAYHSRLRKANLLEVLGLIEMLSDYLKGTAHED